MEDRRKKAISLFSDQRVKYADTSQIDLVSSATETCKNYMVSSSGGMEAVFARTTGIHHRLGLNTMTIYPRMQRCSIKTRRAPNVSSRSFSSSIAFDLAFLTLILPEMNKVSIWRKAICEPLALLGFRCLFVMIPT